MKLDLIKNIAHQNAVLLTLCIAMMCIVPGGLIYTLIFCVLQLICTMFAYNKYLSQKTEIRKTHKTFQHKINRHRKNSQVYIKNGKLKNVALTKHNELLTYLLKENRITKDEIKKFIISRKECKQYLINKNDSDFK